MYDWLDIVSLLLNLILGGGLIVTFVTLKAAKKQAEATAEGSELDNVEKAVRIWRESAEQIAASGERRYNELHGNLTKEIKSMSERMTEMEATINKLNKINGQILKILKDINHDNLEQKKEEAKNLSGVQN